MYIAMHNNIFMGLFNLFEKFKNVILINATINHSEEFYDFVIINGTI